MIVNGAESEHGAKAVSPAKAETTEYTGDGEPDGAWFTTIDAFSNPLAFVRPEADCDVIVKLTFLLARKVPVKLSVRVAPRTTESEY
jgi:hypothetical protein